MSYVPYPFSLHCHYFDDDGIDLGSSFIVAWFRRRFRRRRRRR